MWTKEVCLQSSFFTEHANHAIAREQCMLCSNKIKYKKVSEKLPYMMLKF
jgi:hypothetical protein